MCGRFSLTTAPEAMRALFDYENFPNLAPRYNIAPTQDIAAVRRVADGAAGASRELAMLRWGLVPHWARDRAIGARLINARAETVAEKPAFRDAFKKRRCLVPADGFYEWRREGERKQPFRIGMKDGTPFAFAALWERWAAPEDEAGETLETAAIITTDANDRLRPIHGRMPVILDPADYDAWLDTAATGAAAAGALLRPYPGEAMAFYRVGLRVNNARFDDAACIAPLAAEPAP